VKSTTQGQNRNADAKRAENTLMNADKTKRDQRKSAFYQRLSAF